MMGELPSGFGGRDGILALELGFCRAGAEMAARGSVEINERNSSIQGLTVVNDEAPSASFRTTSTELYVPPHVNNDESPQNGPALFINGLQNARLRIPVQAAVQDVTREKPSARLDNGSKNGRKRKRDHSELATEDVAAAIRSVISAAEAVVVGHLFRDAFSDFPSPIQDHSICMEAALSLAKARDFCGLGDYDLGSSSTDSSDLELDEALDEIMEEAYADVGIVFDMPEDGRRDQNGPTVEVAEVVAAVYEGNVGNYGERGTEVHQDMDSAVMMDKAAVADVSTDEDGQAGDAMAIEVEITDASKAAHSLKSRELHPELSGPSNDRASPETKWRHPDFGKNPIILKDPLHGDATRNFVTPYISRWFGGWSSNAELNQTAAIASEWGTADRKRYNSTTSNDIGSEDAVPEQAAFLARHKSVLFGGQETLTSSLSVSVGKAERHLPQNNEASFCEMSEGGGLSQPEGSHSQQALHMSQTDSLYSFVPSSISPPSALLFSSRHDDHQSEIIAATVEACARTAMNIINSRKVSDCQQTSALQEQLEARGFSVSPVVNKEATVKRTPTVMRKLSTTTDSLSLLLHAVDIAGKSLPNKDCILEGDGLERPRTPSPNLMFRSSPLDGECLEEGMNIEAAEKSTDCDTQTTTDLQDCSLNASGKKCPFKKKGRPRNLDRSMSADLSESPPLLWPRGKKRRLSALRVIDTDSAEWLRDDADDHQMPQKYFNDNEGRTSQNVIQQQSGRPSLKHATRRKLHDPKTLFNGLRFLLTGFSSEKKEKLSRKIEVCGGALLANVPAFSPKQRIKRKGADCGARSPPIVISPQQVRTHKYLYGCAVGSPLLNAGWISASVSAVKCLPYHLFHHKQSGASCVLQAEGREVSKISESSPLFLGLQFHFHGQPDIISQLATLAKHAGGKVIKKLVLNANNKRKQGQKLVGLVVVEGSKNLPLELQRAASKLELHVLLELATSRASSKPGTRHRKILQKMMTDADWMVGSLLSGKLLPFPTDSTPPSTEVPSQRSFGSKSGKPLQSYKRRRDLLRKENIESRGEADSSLELLVRKLKTRSIPEECPSSGRDKSGQEKELEEEQDHPNSCWLGTGFTSPPQVPQLADRLLGPYSHSLAYKKLPNKFLYYAAFLCNGLEYVLGDVVEVRASAINSSPSVARIEGLWSAESSGRKLPQTRAFKQGVLKKAFKNVVLKCRRFYRPSDTGFPGQGGSPSTNELYLSNNIDYNVSVFDIVRRVRVKVQTAKEVVHCSNWYNRDDAGSAQDEDAGQEKASASSICHKTGTTTAASSVTDYFCSFFYDHAQESLHRIKLDV